MRGSLATTLAGVTVLTTVVVGCAQQPAVSSVAPSPRAKSPVAASGSSFPGADAPEGAKRMVEGVSLHFPFRSGTLSINVERTVTTVGVERLRLKVERTGTCRAHPVDRFGGSSVDCPVVWSVDRTVRGTVRVDAQLGTALVTTRLRGQPLKIRAEGAGAPKVQSNPDGRPLLVTMRDAQAAARWGSYRWAWPNRFSAGDAGTGLVYRRFE